MFSNNSFLYQTFGVLDLHGGLISLKLFKYWSLSNCVTVNMWVDIHGMPGNLPIIDVAATPTKLVSTT